MIIIDKFLALFSGIIDRLSIFWKNIVNRIKKAVDKIKEVLRREPVGVKTFIEKTHDGFKDIAKCYIVNEKTREYEEIVYKKDVNERDVPKHILEKANRQKLNVEVSTTEELQLELNS